MSAPAFELIQGDLPADGWATGRLALRIEAAPHDRTVKISVRNPHVAAMHQRNQVRVDLDGERVLDEVLFTGVAMTVERALDAKDDLLVEITSEAVMAPDALDPRERGVFVKVSAVKVEGSK